MTDKKAEITINGKNYELKYTMANLRDLKADCGVTMDNFAKKQAEDLPETLTKMIFYGISKDERQQNGLTSELIADIIELSAMDVIEQAISNGMSKKQKDAVTEAKKKSEKESDAK